MPDLGCSLVLQRESTAGFVLAGGRSSRMGTDKTMVNFEGKPLIVHALSLLRSVCSPVTIAGGVPAVADFAPVLPDETSYQGPLGGIVAALRATSSDWNVFVPVDMPFLPAEALQTLLRTPRGQDTVAVLSQTADHINPLVAMYHRRALPTLAAELAGGRLRVRAAIEAAGQVQYAAFPDAFQQDWFRNLNTPADIALAETMMQTQRR